MRAACFSDRGRAANDRAAPAGRPAEHGLRLRLGIYDRQDMLRWTHTGAVAGSRIEHTWSPADVPPFAILREHRDIGSTTCANLIVDAPARATRRASPRWRSYAARSGTGPPDQLKAGAISGR